MLNYNNFSQFFQDGVQKNSSAVDVPLPKPHAEKVQMVYIHIKRSLVQCNDNNVYCTQ